MTGDKLSSDQWAAYRDSVLPTAADEAKLAEIFADKTWIAPRS